MIKSVGSLPILPPQFLFACGVQMVEGASAPALFALRSPGAAILEEAPAFLHGMRRVDHGSRRGRPQARISTPLVKGREHLVPGGFGHGETFSSKNATRGAGSREKGGR